MEGWSDKWQPEEEERWIKEGAYFGGREREIDREACLSNNSPIQHGGGNPLGQVR